MQWPSVLSCTDGFASSHHCCPSALFFLFSCADDILQGMTLSALGLIGGEKVMLERKNSQGKWPRRRYIEDPSFRHFRENDRVDAMDYQGRWFRGQAGIIEWHEWHDLRSVSFFSFSQLQACRTLRGHRYRYRYRMLWLTLSAWTFFSFFFGFQVDPLMAHNEFRASRSSIRCSPTLRELSCTPRTEVTR